ncbi:hypothetical protein BCV69DRAFT_292382 [Microstroma glucosiphilum]|uniref:Uncharacterized protein n=1 Tax=Pseudomicrostroma glucosiphilum TaxID=1684307 RepID=A0A316UCR7_9BASI|nr:hypothetical protein BCV69DRAFT_292382 [Pseudomicrostroma glucosiphilum]PWN23020.1 hypothetical protein BCV69DRAFT_292382 [Pseudomicrostroma glucosiphilum]
MPLAIAVIVTGIAAVVFVLPALLAGAMSILHGRGRDDIEAGPTTDTSTDDQHINMTQVVASTQHASTSAQPLPYIPASSPSLWAELPSLPCSVEALSQRHKHVQEHQIDLSRLFDDEDNHIDDLDRTGNGAEEATLSPPSNAGQRSATTSVDSEVRAPAPMRDPFELFDVGSPWTQANISTQWQRRLWLGKAAGGDPSSDDAIDTTNEEPRQHRQQRQKECNEPIPELRQSKKKRQSRAIQVVDAPRQQESTSVREVPTRPKKTRLAVELSDEDSDEDQSCQAGPSMSRRHSSPLRPESLPQAKQSLAPLQRAVSPPRAAAQTPRPRPRPRVSSVRATGPTTQTSRGAPLAATDSEDDAPSATQFFTRQKRRRLSPDGQLDQGEGGKSQPRAPTPIANDPLTVDLETPEMERMGGRTILPSSFGLPVTEPVLIRLSMPQAESQASESTALSPEVANTGNSTTLALNDRTVSFGQLSKDDEDALESFVEGMDSDDEGDGTLGAQTMDVREALAIPVASANATASHLRPPSPRRSPSPLHRTSAEAWFSASPSPPPLIEDYDNDDDDPSIPSGLAPLLTDLDEEKRRGYFAQFDSLLGQVSAGSRSLPRARTSATANIWAGESGRDEEEGVGIEWPTTPSARFGSAALAGRALGRADSDSRLLPNRFTGFSRPIVSCSQLLAADVATADENRDADETALDSPSVRGPRRPAGNNTSGLLPRSRNSAGMGLVRKTWGSTWREDGTRLTQTQTQTQW